MINRLRLGQKIAGGFIIILLLLTLVLFSSTRALVNIKHTIEKYEIYVGHSSLMSELQISMLLMRMDVLNYFSTEDDQQSKQYSLSHSKMQKVLSDAKNEIKNREQLALLNTIDDSISIYNESFSRVISLNQEISKLESMNLAPNGELMLKYVNDILTTTYETQNYLAVQAANIIKEIILQQRLYSAKYLYSHRVSDFENASKTLRKKLVNTFSTLKKIKISSKEEIVLNQIILTSEKYDSALSKIHQLINERSSIQNGTLRTVGPDVTNKASQIKSGISSSQKVLRNNLDNQSNQSITVTIVLSVIAIMLGIIFSYCITRNITQPIHMAVEAANQLAKGDLSVSFAHNKQDETGLLLNSLQHTADNLQKMIITISGASNELASASEQLTVVNDKTLQGIVQQEQETELVATAMNEMATTVHDVANNAVKAAEAANSADHEAGAGSRIVEETIHAINTLYENVNNSAEKLHDVQTQVVNIVSILNVIKEIADQTNLLALNAAIEAARAGEQGRGFAVVADEVRALAARTQGSTSEIEAIISQLQAGTQSTVAAMQVGKSQAESCVIKANDTGKALQSIIGAITVINDMNDQIASASEQQSIVAETINENVMKVRNVAEENAVAANQTKSTSNEIAKLAVELNQLVAVFKVS